MTTHVEDGALVRYVDREDAPAERVDVTGHLAGCDRCTARLAELTRAGDAFSAALHAADVPAPARRPAPRWGVRAAAAVLVLGGIAGAVQPVRAWILERTEALWTAVTGRSTPVSTPVPDPVRSASVAFVPSGNEFTLEVTARQAGGVLRLETVAGDTATALVRGGSGAEDLVVLPSMLRIVNPSSSRASYEIRLPARLARVRVRVGAGEPWDYRPGSGTVEIELENR
jgi:anti-sigma factor RsiW